MSAADHTYRPDIDGLRAVAVLSVVLYHAGLPVLPGGFVGVDIFFVISGYLITRIIAREIAEDRFSILTFYERRTRRIFPALFVMLGVCVAAAGLITLPAEFESFGNSLAAATLFVSNIYFWQTADYFGGPAHLQPLLHTWSLAVEEQFYIVLPLLLLALTRWAHSHLIRWLLALTVLSFALSVWAVAEKPNAAFYLLPARFWELMVGALLALGAFPAIRSRALAETATAFGFTLIATAVLSFSSATPFPGWAALLPVVGAALIIHAGSLWPETMIARALGRPPVVFIGVVSYSFYLWHWPLLTFARISRGEALTGTEAAVLVAISFILAVLSWRFVETPFRQRRIMAARAPLFGAAAGAMAALLAVGAFANSSQGWPQRHDGYDPPAIAGMERMQLATCFLNDTQTDADWAAEDCRRGPTRHPVIFVWGDSFAAHLMPGLTDELGDRFQTIQFTAGGCPPVLGVSLANRPHCRAFNDRALAEIARLKPDVVLVSARWDLYTPRTIAAADIRATLTRISEIGTRVVAIGASPAFDFASPYDYVYRTGRQEARANVTPVMLDGVTVFDPASLFCKERLCRLVGDEGFLFFDGGHYSVEGSRQVARALAASLDAMFADQHPLQTSGVSNR